MGDTTRCRMPPMRRALGTRDPIREGSLILTRRARNTGRFVIGLGSLRQMFAQMCQLRRASTLTAHPTMPATLAQRAPPRGAELAAAGIDAYIGGPLRGRRGILAGRHRPRRHDVAGLARHKQVVGPPGERGHAPRPAVQRGSP
jgi:hypothetical protein